MCVLCEHTFARYQPLSTANIVSKIKQRYGIHANEVEVVDNAALMTWCANNDISIYQGLLFLPSLKERRGDYQLYKNYRYENWLIPISFILGIYRTEQLPIILQHIVDGQGIIVLDALHELEDPDESKTILDINAIFSTLMALNPNLRFVALHDFPGINTIKAKNAHYFLAKTDLIDKVVKIEILGDRGETVEGSDISSLVYRYCYGLRLQNVNVKILQHFPDIKQLQIDINDQKKFDFLQIAFLPLQALDLTISAGNEDTSLFNAPPGMINKTLVSLKLTFRSGEITDNRLIVLKRIIEFYPNIRYLYVNAVSVPFLNLYQHLPLYSLDLQYQRFSRNSPDFSAFIEGLPFGLQRLNLYYFSVNNVEYDKALLQSKLQQLNDLFINDHCDKLSISAFIVPSLQRIRINIISLANITELSDALAKCHDLHIIEFIFKYKKELVNNPQEFARLITVLGKLPNLRFCSLQLGGRDQPDFQDCNIDWSDDLFPRIEQLTLFALNSNIATNFCSNHPDVAIAIDGEDDLYTAMQRRAWPLFSCANPLLATGNVMQVFESLNSDIAAPDPRFYRLQVGGTVCIPEDLKILNPRKDFIFSEDLDEARSNTRSECTYFFASSMEINLTEQWQAIPSAYPVEKLHCLLVAKNIQQHLKFAYSVSRGLHYVYSDIALCLPLCYVLEVNPTLNQFATVQNTQLLQAMRNHSAEQFVTQCQSPKSCMVFGISDVKVIENQVGRYIEARDINGKLLLLKGNQSPINLQLYNLRTKKWESERTALLPPKERRRIIRSGRSVRKQLADELLLWSENTDNTTDITNSSRAWSNLSAVEKAIAFAAAPVAALNYRRQQQRNAQRKNFALGQTQALQKEVQFDDGRGKALKAVLRFYGVNCATPHPAKYRLHIFRRFNPDAKSLSNALVNKLPSDIEGTHPPRVTDKQQAFAMQKAGYDYYEHKPYTVNITTQWQALPSLFPYEKMHCLLDCDPSIKFGYSKEIRQHFIKADACISTQLHFFLEINPAEKPGAQSVPFALKLEQKRIRKFDPLRGQMQVPVGLSLFDFLAQINHQAQGACLHRSVVMLWLAQHPNYLQGLSASAVQVVGNSIHLFVECQVGEILLSLDLGGAETALQIIDPQTNESMSEEQFFTKQKCLQSAVSSQQFTFSSFALANKRFILPDAQACQKYAFIMAKKWCGHSAVFFANEASDLCAQQASAVCYTNGYAAIVPAPSGALYHFVSQNQAGVIIIDASAIKDEALVAVVNGLSETPRILGGLDLPTNMQVILVCHQGNYAGADLCSRFQSNITLSVSAADLADIEETFMPITLEKTDAKTRQVNLYADADELMTALFGNLSVRGEQLVHQTGLLNQTEKEFEKIAICRYVKNDKLIRLIQKLTANSSAFVNGQVYSLPTLCFSELQYGWPAILATHEFMQKADAEQLQQCHVLNQQTFSDFFSCLYC